MPTGQRKFDDETEQAIAQEYEGNTSISLRSLGEKYGCSLHMIRKVLVRRGVPRRHVGGERRVFTEDEIRTMAEAWQHGESQTTIALRFRVSQVNVSRVLLHAGIEPVGRIRRGAQHASWKGGRVISSGGYILVRLEHDDPFFSMTNSMGYASEHRIVMARHLGRVLTRKETVHHINGDRADNRVENLQLRNGNHGNGVAYRCLDCGSERVETISLH